MLTIRQFTVNPIGEHTYVLSDESGECVIVDPGCLGDDERDAVDAYIGGAGLRPAGLWFTHLHFDHVWGARHLIDRYGVAASASQGDEAVMSGNARMCEAWNLPAPESFTVDHYVAGGDSLSFGHSRAQVIATPGHTPGGLSFYFAEDGVCLTGDTLFRQSVGRTDFEGGDQAAIVDSVRSRLLTLPETTRVLPGHGPETTVGFERLCNPYVCDD